MSMIYLILVGREVDLELFLSSLFQKKPTGEFTLRFLIQF